MAKRDVVHKGKSRIWIASIIAALVAAVSVFAVMLQLEKNLLMEYEKGSIFIAAKEIPKGQRITADNYDIYLAEMELDKNCIPSTALSSKEQIEEMFPVAGIEKGVLLTTGMFEKREEIAGEMEKPVIAGLKADDLYQIAGGILRAGDRINIYCVSEEGITMLHWQDVFVYQVFDSAGNLISNEDKQTAAQRINVYLDESDVEQFYSELFRGSLRVVKVCD